MELYYRRSQAERIELYAALEDGGFLWAIAGYVWDLLPSRLEESLRNVREAAQSMQRDPTTALTDYHLLGVVIESLHPEVDDLPTPRELAVLSTATSPNLGETLMRQAHWYGVMYL